jgi:xylose isomerase
MKQPKHALITGFLGNTTDRFRTYNKKLSLEEKFDLMNRIEGMDGVELVYPYEVNDGALVKSLLDKAGLNMAAVNANIKSDDMFLDGSISSPDPKVRAEAVKIIKGAKDFAQAVGADKVQCCPLGDGYEFSFQHDYRDAQKYMTQCIAEAGAYKPEIPLFIEYKPSEVRGKCFLDTAAKTLCMLKDIGNKDIGVTLDFGHSIYGPENPAEALCLISESDYPVYLHINDNDGTWDWDYMAGSKHFLDYVEFVYYIKQIGYDDYLTSDTSPMRLDIQKTFEANVRMTNKIWQLIDVMGMAEIEKMVKGNDFMATWKYLEDNLFFRGLNRDN